MGNFRLDTSYGGLGVIIGMHMLLNTSLVGCRGKLIVFAFLLRLTRRYSLKFNLGIRILITNLINLKLLTGTSLGVLQ